MASVSIYKFLAVVYDTMLREKIKTRVSFIGGPSRIINISFNAKKEAAYTLIEGKKKDRFRIVLGGGLVKKIANLPDRVFKRSEIEPCAEDIFKSFYALLNHELGHDLYTDMVSTEISLYPKEKYRGFMHTMFNVLEDVVIEECMVELYNIKFPYDVNPRVYFDYMIERMFEPQLDEYTDDGTQAGFINYILIKLRCGGRKPKNSCPIYDKYKKDLNPLMLDVLTEENGTQRVHKTVVLCEWIIDNIKEFSWEMPEPEEIISGKGAGSGVGVPMPAPGGGMSPSKGGRLIKGDEEEDESPSGKLGGDGDPEGKPDEESEGEDESETKDDESEDEEPEEDDEEEEEDEKEDEEEEETYEDDEEKVEKDIDEDVFSTVFNDDYHDGDDHMWSYAKEDFEIKDSSVTSKIDEIIENNIHAIREVSDFLTLFKGRIKPMRTEGMRSGRLSARRAISNELRGGCDTKIFQRKLARGRDADAVLSLLCDLSGSMDGEKSEVCAQACVILAQACEWSGIPFEVNAFVKTFDGRAGISYTIVEKEFTDTFESAKPYLGINSSELLRCFTVHNDVPTFAGNSEEVNLYYIWQKYKKVKHKTKLMFVLCDGATTGSKNNLRETVAKMESEDNIIVIGIGIVNTDVEDSYRHCKVFRTIKDVEEGLASYLIDTVTEYAM